MRAEQFLSFALLRARQPADPYGDNSLRQAARFACVELLAARPELEQIVVAAEGVSSTAELPISLELVALGIRRRGDIGGHSIRKYSRTGIQAKTSRLTSPGMRTSRRDRWAVTYRRNRFQRRIVRSLLRIGSAFATRIVVPLAPAVLGFTAYWAEWPKPPLDLTMEVAVAALAVLVTVNVFTVQLAATRLPGPVARVVGQPRSLDSAYPTVVAVIAAVMWSPDSERLGPAVSWSAFAGTGLFVLLLVASIRTFSRRTSPLEAVRAYRKVARAKFRSAGRRIGRMQARSPGCSVVAGV